MTAVFFVFCVVGISIDDPLVQAGIAKHKTYLVSRKVTEERLLKAKQAQLDAQRRNAAKTFAGRGDPVLVEEVSALIKSVAKLKEHLFAIDDNWVGAATYNYRCVNDAQRNNYKPAVGDLFRIESESPYRDNLMPAADRAPWTYDDLYLVGFIRSGENVDISRLPVVVRGLKKDTWQKREGIYIVLRLDGRQPVIEKIDGTGPKD